MKKLLIIMVLTNAFIGLSQKQLAFVANGGKFEFGVETYQDRATIGVIDLQAKTYTTLDTIQVESVQAIDLSTYNDGKLFVAAQDSIVSYFYDFDNEKLIEKEAVGFSGIKTLVASIDYVVAGRDYGYGDFVVIYDLELNELFASPTIKTSVKDILVLNDTLVAVSYNLQGSVDGCSPYGCFEDSIGKIDVIDLLNQETVTTIDLGAKGKGKITLSKGILGSYDIISVSEKNQLVTYIDSDFNIEYDTVVTGLVETISEDTQYNFGAIYMVNDNDSVVMVTYNSQDREFEFGMAQNNAFTKSVWQLSDVYSFETDYDTYGRVYYNFHSDSIEVGVSLEDLTRGSFGLLCLFNTTEINSEKNNAYMVSEVSDLGLSNVGIYARSGQLILEVEDTEYFNHSDLESGIYIMKGVKNDLPVTYRILKN